MPSGSKTSGCGLWLLQFTLGVTGLLFGCDHLISGIPGMEFFGSQLAYLGIRMPPPIFWGAAVAGIEVVASIMVVIGRYVRTASFAMLIPMLLETAARIQTGAPDELLFPIVVAGGFLGLALINKQRN